MIENNPKYSNLSPIVNNALGRNWYIFSDEKNLSKNLKILRKIPHLNLLGNNLKILGKLIIRLIVIFLHLKKEE